MSINVGSPCGQPKNKAGPSNSGTYIKIGSYTVALLVVCVVDTMSSKWHARLSHIAALTITCNGLAGQKADLRPAAFIARWAHLLLEIDLRMKEAHPEHAKHQQLRNSHKWRYFGNVTLDGVCDTGPKQDGSKELAYGSNTYCLPNGEGFRAHARTKALQCKRIGSWSKLHFRLVEYTYDLSLIEYACNV